MKKSLLLVVLAFLIIISCSVKPTEHKTENNLLLKFSLSDSLGVNKTIFNLNEQILLNFSIENISRSDYQYHVIPYMSEIFFYAVEPIESGIEPHWDYLCPPEVLEQRILSPYARLVQEEIFEISKPGQYILFLEVVPIIPEIKEQITILFEVI